MNGQPKDELSLSVVIPTHNRKTMLQCLLRCLALQKSETMFEVVAVDDGSEDGTAAAVAEMALPYPLRVISGPCAGPAAARNKGVVAARAPIILFLDDDVIPSPQLIAEHLHRHSDDGDAVVVGRISSCPGHRIPPWERWEQTILERNYARVIRGENRADGALFYTGNVSARRKSLLAVGGFDISLAFHEDVDLGRRLEAAGAHFYYAPDADARHRGYHTFDGWCRRHYQFGRHRIARWQRAGADARLPDYYRQLNALTRLIVRLVIGRPKVSRAIAGALHAAASILNALHLWPLSYCTYSALANLHNFWGLHDAAGGRDALWALVRRRVPAENASEQPVAFKQR